MSTLLTGLEAKTVGRVGKQWRRTDGSCERSSQSASLRWRWRATDAWALQPASVLELYPALFEAQAGVLRRPAASRSSAGAEPPRSLRVAPVAKLDVRVRLPTVQIEHMRVGSPAASAAVGGGVLRGFCAATLRRHGITWAASPITRSASSGRSVPHRLYARPTSIRVAGSCWAASSLSSTARWHTVAIDRAYEWAQRFEPSARIFVRRRIEHFSCVPPLPLSPFGSELAVFETIMDSVTGGCFNFDAGTFMGADAARVYFCA
ncbi:hypothetical protein T492DRAFT_1135118 [Pavlovales sp. CCMP2436]|nr:hypothetical protein T492DRAFT_1135118 [Pavlovales sp. CCMP2436]